MKLMLQKINTGQYEVWTEDRKRVGLITQTGGPGRDTYPWEWLIPVGIRCRKATGTAETRRSALDQLNAALGVE